MCCVAVGISVISTSRFYSRESESIRDERDIKYDGCANDVSKEIVKLKRDSIAGLILDLRYNGGGSMCETMQLAGIFIDIGGRFRERPGRQTPLPERSQPRHHLRRTAYRTGEWRQRQRQRICECGITGYNRALIVGGPTYGKGTAQIVLPMDTLTPSRDKTYLDFVKVTEPRNSG